MNKIYEDIVKARNGHYCHCVEVSHYSELEGIAESIVEEYEEKYGMEEVISFLDSLDVYFLEDTDRTADENMEIEEEVYAFSFKKYLT